MNRVIKSLIVVFFVFCSSCKENVVKVKSEQDANRILLSLREGRIDATKQLEGAEWLIKVPQGQFTEALRVLESRRILEKVNLVKSTDKSTDFFASKEQRQKEYLQSISQEIGVSLNMFPGVLDSRIHIYRDVENENDKFNRSGASVVLLVEPEASIDQESIKLLVSKASGILAESVVVVVKQVDKRNDLSKVEESKASIEILEVRNDSVKKETALSDAQDETGILARYFIEYQKLAKKGLIVFACLVLVSLFIFYIRSWYRRKKEYQVLKTLGA